MVGKTAVYLERKERRKCDEKVNICSIDSYDANSIFNWLWW